MSEKDFVLQLMDLLVSPANHGIPDILLLRIAFIRHMLESKGSESACKAITSAPNTVDVLCQALVDAAVLECGAAAVSDFVGLLLFAKEGNLTTTEMRHLLRDVQFAGEVCTKRNASFPSRVDAGGRGSVGGELLCWGKWMLVRNALAPVGKELEGLHAQTLSLLSRNLRGYCMDRFHAAGVSVELHSRMGYMYRRLADPEGGCTWRGSGQLRALRALGHHFRGAGMTEVGVGLVCDIGYLEACLGAGQGREILEDILVTIHTGLAQQCVSRVVLLQAAQIHLWLARNLTSGFTLSVNPQLLFQSCANERGGSAPHTLAMRRLYQGWAGINWLRQINTSNRRRRLANLCSPPSLSSTIPNYLQTIPIRSIAAHVGRVTGLAISRCSSLWVSAGDDGLFKVFGSLATLEVTVGGADEEGRSLRSTAVALSPESNLLATASQAGGVLLFDTRTGIQCASLTVRKVLSQQQGASHTHHRPEQREQPATQRGVVVTSMSFSGGAGALLLVACADGHCRIFEMDTSVCRWCLVREGHPLSDASLAAPLRCCSWSINDAMAAGAGADRLVLLWNTDFVSAGGKGARREAATIHASAHLKGHTGNVNCLDWAPDGYRFVSGADDCILFLWDTALLEQHRREDARDAGAEASLPHGAQARLEGHKGPVLAATWSWSGRYIIASDYAGSVLVWSCQSFTVLFDLSGHTCAVYSVALGLGDGTLLTGGADGELLITDLRAILPAPPPGGNSRASEDDLVSVTKSALAIQETGSLTERYNDEGDEDSEEENIFNHHHKGRVTAINYSPGAMSMVSAGADGKLIFRNAESGRGLSSPTLATPSSAGLFDARFLATAAGFLVTAAGDGVVAIWDTRDVLKGGGDLRKVRSLEGHSGAALAAVGSPVREHILSSSKDLTCRLWDVETGGCISRLNHAAFTGTGRTGATSSLDFSAAGDLVLTAGGAREVWVWDLRTLSPVRRLIGSPLECICAAFSPAGNEIVGGSRDGCMRIWDMMSGRLQHTAQRLHTAAVTSCRYSTRGAHLMSCSEDGSLVIADAFDFEEVGRWASNSALSAVDCCCCADIKGGHVACGDETGLITLLATHVGLCGRWTSF